MDSQFKNENVINLKLSAEKYSGKHSNRVRLGSMNLMKSLFVKGES
jgi:hypothetical protein